MSSYKKGTIYKIICCVSDEIYIGSTFNTLRNRWQQHKSIYRKWINNNNYSKICIAIYPYFKKYGIENFKIIKVKDYVCVDRRHLESKEQLWISKSKCVNTRNNINIKRLYRKLYRENNKEKIKEDKRKYNEENKDKISRKHKEYRANNRDKMREQHKKRYEKIKKKQIKNQKKPYTCITCNTTIKIGGKSRHEKTQKHLKNLK